MSVLNRPEIVAKIAEETGSTKTSVDAMLSSFERVVTEGVVEGREVKVSGFLAISQTIRSARVMKNPRTGEDIEVPEQSSVKIRPLTRLRNAIKGE